tara:strand:+ start:132380 stop:132799 length:420 start_codon:yes stop_codon:yes gene_type:complete
MTNFFRVDVAASVFAIIAGIIHLGAYWGFWWSPAETGAELFWRVGITVACIVIATIIVASVSAATNKDAPAADERESRVQFKAMRNMLFAYSGGLAILFMESFAGVSEPMALAHAVIGIFIFAELVRLPSLWVYLREPG